MTSSARRFDPTSSARTSSVRTQAARARFARRAALATAGALTCAGALAACTSSSTPPAPTSPVMTPSPRVSSPVAHNSSTAAPTSDAPTSSAAHTSAHPSRSSTSASKSSTGAAPSSSAAAGPAPCANGQLRTTATQAGALPGEEIAILTFTDTSADSCTVTGFPGVELLAGNRVLGKPAARSSLAVHTLVLAPNQAVTARLTDDTRCNAPLSDTIGIYPPNQTVQVRLPLKLRGCALTVDPVRR